MPDLIGRLKPCARQLTADTYVLYLAYRDPRVPWYAKVVAARVVAYAFSPIDLIPDFIPILGYLDDLIIIPAGIRLALRLIPSENWRECRGRARAELDWLAAGLIIVLWLVVAAWAVRGLAHLWEPWLQSFY